VLEIFSGFFRVTSVVLRITGNLLAGHVILHVFNFFAFLNLKFAMSYLFITIVEVGLSWVQIYVFVTLACMY
jgi:F0F1-type ATP synthase membrane subunit a